MVPRSGIESKKIVYSSDGPIGSVGGRPTVRLSLENFFGFMMRQIVEIFNRFCSISLDLNSFVRKYDEEILFEEDFGNELNTQAGFQINTIE